MLIDVGWIKEESEYAIIFHRTSKYSTGSNIIIDKSTRTVSKSDIDIRRLTFEELKAIALILEEGGL